LTDIQSVSKGDDQGRETALAIADLIADSPASNTVVLDIRELSTIADFFVICSGENERQLRAIANDIHEGMSEAGVKPRRGDEGSTASGWLLLDYGDVIVHVMDVDQREFYRLEEMWADAPTLLAIE
jgi:ribosome-associated protein